MGRLVGRLTALQVQRAKRGKLHDGDGLYLSCHRDGSKSWVFRYGAQGKRHCGLGPLHTITLMEARERARKCRQLLLDGCVGTILCRAATVRCSAYPGPSAWLGSRLAKDIGALYRRMVGAQRPHRDVIFRQEHLLGRMGVSDFTDTAALASRSRVSRRSPAIRTSGGRLGLRACPCGARRREFWGARGRCRTFDQEVQASEPAGRPLSDNGGRNAEVDFHGDARPSFAVSAAFEPSLCPRRSPFPGNGILRPETNRRNRHPTSGEPSLAVP